MNMPSPAAVRLLTEAAVRLPSEAAARFRAEAAKRILITDGAWGTMIQTFGLQEAIMPARSGWRTSRRATTTCCA
jgi:hypothetical protein